MKIPKIWCEDGQRASFVPGGRSTRTKGGPRARNFPGPPKNIFCPGWSHHPGQKGLLSRVVAPPGTKAPLYNSHSSSPPIPPTLRDFLDFRRRAVVPLLDPTPPSHHRRRPRAPPSTAASGRAARASPPHRAVVPERRRRRPLPPCRRICPPGRGNGGPHGSGVCAAVVAWRGCRRVSSPKP